MACLALAAMDNSESVEMPLDYLQGHKDALEWAAKLAEANHPETGDWLYDDPIELAKAIRKGPDMPPAQPAADSEPVAWTWHYREQWHVTNDSRRAEFVAKDCDVAVLPLYRHAQQPVVMAEAQSRAAFEQWCTVNIERNKWHPEFYAHLPVREQWAAWEACRAAMLAAALQSWIPVSEQKPENKPGSYEYLVFETLNNRVNHDYWNVPSEGDDAFTPFWNYYGEHVTHWMPLPAGPQEVK
nr:DUF551 domain-containing protein [Klebsiella variicola]